MGVDGWVLGHVYWASNFFLTNENRIKIGGTKLGNGGSIWVGFGTRRRRAYWASGLITVAAAHNLALKLYSVLGMVFGHSSHNSHNSLVMMKKSFVNHELCS